MEDHLLGSPISLKFEITHTQKSKLLTGLLTQWGETKYCLNAFHEKTSIFFLLSQQKRYEEKTDFFIKLQNVEKIMTYK